MWLIPYTLERTNSFLILHLLVMNEWLHTCVCQADGFLTEAWRMAYVDTAHGLLRTYRCCGWPKPKKSPLIRNPVHLWNKVNLYLWKAFFKSTSTSHNSSYSRNQTAFFTYTAMLQQEPWDLSLPRIKHFMWAWVTIWIGATTPQKETAR